MRLTLCLLTWNELEGCRHDVPLIDRTLFDDIYAVDGGSQDGTRQYLEEQGIPVYIQPKPGLNAAHIFAVARCQTEAIVFFHPKGSVSVDTLKSFRIYFEQGYQLIIASRVIKGGHCEEDKSLFRPRKYLSLGLAYFTALLWRREGSLIRDVLHGFRGYTVDAFKVIDPMTEGLSIDIESVVRSYKRRLKRIEFPVTEKERIAGTTHFKIWPTGKKLFKYLCHEFTRP